MLRTIAKWAGGRRAKWYVVGFWLLLLVLSQMPGKLTDVTEDRISSFLSTDLKLNFQRLSFEDSNREVVLREDVLTVSADCKMRNIAS